MFKFNNLLIFIETIIPVSTAKILFFQLEVKQKHSSLVDEADNLLDRIYEYFIDFFQRPVMRFVLDKYIK